jgi:hypothetical protein
MSILYSALSAGHISKGSTGLYLEHRTPAVQRVVVERTIWVLGVEHGERSMGMGYGVWGMVYGVWVWCMVRELWSRVLKVQSSRGSGKQVLGLVPGSRI